MRLILDYFSPLKIGLGLFALAAIVSALIYYFANLDSLILWSAEFVPMAFAVVGIIFSVKKLREEHHFAVIALLLIVGTLGTVVLHLSRTHTEAAHAKQIAGLRERMDSWQTQNGQLLNAFLSKPPQSSQEAEMERRHNIQKALLGEYILSHSNVSQGMLAGTELPPADWMNKRLGELGEKWTVSSPTLVRTLPQSRPQLARAFFASEGDPPHEINAPMIDGIVTTRVVVYGIGDVTAHNVSVWIRLCIGCEWAKEPSGMGAQPFIHDAPASDRQWKFSQVYPGVFAPTMTIDIRPPKGVTNFGIAIFYACDECGQINREEAAKNQLIVHIRG